MARKTLADLPSHRRRAFDQSWAALGWDTSMSSVACVGVGYDGLTDKFVGPSWAEIRWYPDDDYFKRLAQAADAKSLAFDVLSQLWVIKTENIWMAFEEPWYYGAVRGQTSEWLKQMAEVSGAVKGSLAKYGFVNLFEINNQQWAKTLRDKGVPLGPPNRKDPDRKWKVKRWAIEEFGLPDLPDLVKSKTGAKIPRPEKGFGARAKAVQPNDVYDAAAICLWMRDFVVSYLGNTEQGGAA